MKLIDKSGYNYLIVEFNLKPSVYIDQFRRWLHIKRVEMGQWYNKVKYGRYSGLNARGRYTWTGGCWVPGHIVDRSLWHTFFDYGMGRTVSGSAEIREHEKTGRIYTTYEEAERECAKKKFEVKMKQKQRIRKGVEQALEDISRGRRSYAREIEQQSSRDMKLIRERQMTERALNVR